MIEKRKIIYCVHVSRRRRKRKRKNDEKSFVKLIARKVEIELDSFI